MTAQGHLQRFECAPAASAVTLIVLQNSQMRCRQNFAARPSERVLGDPMPCKELTKAVGWKSDQSCDPPHNFRVSAPAPLGNFVRTLKKSFATESAMSGHSRRLGKRTFLFVLSKCYV
jgi:hypothetical protein